MHIDHVLKVLHEVKDKNPHAKVHIEVEGDPIPVRHVSPFKTINEKGHVVTDVILHF